MARKVRYLFNLLESKDAYPFKLNNDVHIMANMLQKLKKNIMELILIH